jgi:hypothetical protein
MGIPPPSSQHLASAFEDHRLATVYTRYRTPPTSALERYLGLVQSEVDLLLDAKTPVHLADVGAGSGLYIRPLFARIRGLAGFVAIEPAHAMATELSAHVAELRNGTVLQDAIPLATPLPQVSIVWISDVAHLFKNPSELVDALDRSFPNARSFILRNNTKDTIARVDWARHFPSLLAEDRDRQPDVQSLVDAFENIRAPVQYSFVVDESFNLSRDEYIRYYESRPFSGIRMLHDDQFELGMRSLRSHVSALGSVQRTLTRHLIVARRTNV